MDQIIETFGIDWKIFGAEVINFLIVLGILYYFVFRKISAMLDSRTAIIQQGVTNAAQASDTLASAQQEKQDILHQAGEQATAEIKASVETGKRREVEIVDSANARSDNIIAEALDKGELLKQKILDSSQAEIAKMAVLGAEKILSSSK